MAILSRKENTSKHVRLPFTKTEEAALRKGVELHGTGSWAVILGSGHFATQRTNIDLKDKWRNLMARTVADGAVGHSYAAGEKRLARLDRKRPARDVLSAPEHRATRSAKRSPVDEPQLVGLRPYLNDIHRLYLETEVPCPLPFHSAFRSPRLIAPPYRTALPHRPTAPPSPIGIRSASRA